MKAAWLWLIKHTLNRFTMRLARRGVGWFAIVRHTGRKSGQVYEGVIILAPVREGFVAELTYGDQVNWYRNLVAAGGGEVIRRGVTYRVDAVSEITEEEGYQAFGPPYIFVFRLLRRKHFRLLHVEGR